MAVEQPITSSALLFADARTNINEINGMSPTRNTTASLSLPSAGIKGRQQTTIKSTNPRRFPLRLRATKRQSHSLEKNTDELHQVKSKSIRSSVPSLAEDKLNDIIENLNENPVEEDPVSITGPSTWISQSRQFVRRVMSQPYFHYGIIILVIIDLIVVFIELTIEQLSVPCLTEHEMEAYNTTEQRSSCLLPITHQTENVELALYYISLIIISTFVLEVLSAFYAFGWRRYTKILYLFDAIIVLSSFIMEVYFHFGNTVKAGRASGALVVLRLWKVVRAIHAIAHSISLRNHMIIEKIKGAQEILQKEILEAEKTIREQNIEINKLTILLEKTDTRTTPEQIDGFTQRRTMSISSVTLF